MEKTQKHNQPVYASGNTVSCTEIAAGIFSLKLDIAAAPTPECGQFFMLRAVPSGILLSRPVSVYAHSGSVIEFLILLKGQGTAELCALRAGDPVEVLGPQGNVFPQPAALNQDGKLFPAIIGGGIGVAPVAGFASALPAKSYDFYASFRHESYGLAHVQPAELIVTTDDGHEGVKGMLPAVFSADTIRRRGYSEVYACGPVPMLSYIRDVCAEAGVPCWISMEARMACGVGACLGCTIRTTAGNRRCCKDGPVFDASTVLFDAPAPGKRAAATNGADAKNAAAQHAGSKPGGAETPVHGAEPDLSVQIAGVRFANPVIAASGTFGYGSEYAPLLEVNNLGGICSKGLTLEPRAGNTGVRLHETPSGLINSIGLENPGIPAFIAEKLPMMLSLKPVTIANLSGSSVESYVEGARLLNETAVPMIELNISCPNVKAGGMAFGLEPEAAAEVTAAVRAVVQKPLVVKLSPNAPHLTAVADAVRRAGADALSLVNTFQALAIDIEKGKPLFDNITAGLAGPAVRPVALRMVYDVCAEMRQLPESERIPVIGLGGIRTWQDAVEFIMAGAAAVQVGTAGFSEPDCMNRIIAGIRAFMVRKGYRSISDFCGIALPHPGV